MERRHGAALALITSIILLVSVNAMAQPSQVELLKKNVNHVLIAVQENHSFDNYFGVLALAKNGPYHQPAHGAKTCAKDPHPTTCVNGLKCSVDSTGKYICSNSNEDDDGSMVAAFHSSDYCPSPDLDHGWASSHLEGNHNSPNDMLKSSPNDGFVLVNDQTEQTDTSESPTEDETIGFYNENDLPYYYGLAETFAIDDNYFCDVIGPTFPNRAYLHAATSFGHLTTNEEIPPSGGYKPITGTIFDKLDAAGITWVDYFSDLPSAGVFRTPVGPNFKPIAAFFADAAAGNLPQVAFIDPLFVAGGNLATDEHPPHDIRSGELYMSQIVSAVRNSPNWKDSILFITYDEHGGFYDHEAPPKAKQGGALNPDGINPGQCADLSNPPTSTEPGMGANCTTSQTSDAPGLCPAFTPSGPYPSDCANFDQLGFRVPFIAVSPFSKQHYVSHTVGGHTSLLKLIELRWLNGGNLTLRDKNANPMLDLFDFKNSPSVSVNLSSLPSAPPPNLATDGSSCSNTPSPGSVGP